MKCGVSGGEVGRYQVSGGQVSSGRWQVKKVRGGRRKCGVREKQGAGGADMLWIALCSIRFKMLQFSIRLIF